jgi:glycosyltransferase involved in cell wall biosynthesis
LNKKVLVVDGQRLNLERCGGAGRYSEQLHKRLTAQNEMELFTGIDICFSGFIGKDQKVADAPLEKKTNVDLLKHAIFRCCPPILFDRLQQVYSYIHGTSSPDYSLENVSHFFHLPWFRPATSILLHELTNYGAIEGIGRLSLSRKIILAVTFLDIQDYYYPEYFHDAQLTSRRLTYSFYKDRADFFFAISEFTKQTMVDRLNINPDKIKVTPLAADDMFIIESSEKNARWVQSLGRYWIYPAKAWKHKNHDFLLKSLSKRKDELKRAGVKLFLIGGFSDDDSQRLGMLIRDNDLYDIVEILGFVSDEQLQALLRGADYLVFPSLFEGFGMPILEAMTLGCPVLSSNAGSLPEVGGDAAVYFDPTSEDEFIALIDVVLAETGLDRASLIQKGFENCIIRNKSLRSEVSKFDKNPAMNSLRNCLILQAVPP